MSSTDFVVNEPANERTNELRSPSPHHQCTTHTHTHSDAAAVWRSESIQVKSVRSFLPSFVPSCWLLVFVVVVVVVGGGGGGGGGGGCCLLFVVGKSGYHT